MLTCRQLTELVTDYLEGRLSFAQRLSFQMHIGMCKHCRAYLRQMKTTVRTLGKMPEEPMPAAVRDALLARFQSAHPAPPHSAAVVPWPVVVLSVIERIAGSKRGWALGALMLVTALVLVVARGLEPGPIDGGTRCLLTELGTSSALLAVLGILASTRRARISVATWTAVAIAGSFVGFAVLEIMCPMRHVGAHVLVFHLGGMMLAGLMGLFTSRLPAFR